VSSSLAGGAKQKDRRIIFDPSVFCYAIICSLLT
jgi:hypothetical protein